MTLAIGDRVRITASWSAFHKQAGVVVTLEPKLHREARWRAVRAAVRQRQRDERGGDVRSDSPMPRCQSAPGHTADDERDAALVHLRNAAERARNRAVDLKLNHSDGAKQMNKLAGQLGQLANEIERGEHCPWTRKRSLRAECSRQGKARAEVST